MHSYGILALKTEMPIVLSVDLVVGTWTCYELRCSAVIREASGQLPGSYVDRFLDGRKAFCGVLKLVGNQCKVYWWCLVPSAWVLSQVLQQLEWRSSRIDGVWRRPHVLDLCLGRWCADVLRTTYVI